jgi:TolB-like protein/Tfp pilus assembly protein PilF
MRAESPNRVGAQTGAVFLSYASEDVAAAERIASALRAVGIEVWIDKSELRGGDAWDQSIRKQIKTCALFIPIISRHAHDRIEGYFRLEWKLAVDRSHLIAPDQAFLLPVAIDDTPQSDERIPDRFRELQWTCLPDGETSPAFVERVRGLLSRAQPDTGAKTNTARADPAAVATAGTRPFALRSTAVPLVIAAVTVLALGYLALERLVRSKPAVSATSTNSIAVLPLTNESGDASQQYFSDGLSEDLITALSQFPGLKVIGRTSSFQFRDSRDDSRTIGAKLGVARLLEGSVRHAGDLVRVSAELIDTSDGSTQWSERYDRPYKDLFALQDDLTRAVAGALKTRLIPGENRVQQSDRPPSGNLDAYNALLEGKFYYGRFTEADFRKAIERFTLATQLDPRYALAWSYVSTAWSYLSAYYLDFMPAEEANAKARAAAETALALAPDLANAHIARGFVLRTASFDWRGAEAEWRRALELAPGDGDAKVYFAESLATFGQLDKAVELIQQALASDPLRASWYGRLAYFLSMENRLDEAERAVRKAIELQPEASHFHFDLTRIEIQRGNAKAALAAAQQEPAGLNRDAALALALQIGSDHAAADAALQTEIARRATSDPYTVAQIYAIRNDADKTFEWLDRAWSYRDPGIASLLINPFLTRYKDDPRFAAFCRKVGLPMPSERAGG